MLVELESNQAQMLKSLEWFVENDDTNIGMPVTSSGKTG